MSWGLATGGLIRLSLLGWCFKELLVFALLRWRGLALGCLLGTSFLGEGDTSWIVTFDILIIFA